MDELKNIQSPDWNNERLAALKKLMPDLFTNEGKLNTEEIKKLADPEAVSEIERYEFRWFGKSAAKRNAFTPSNATLVYDEHKSVDPDKSENIIIEGENLEVLKLLSYSYREKIKCIYIDPPYNTGKDFVYSDNYTEDKRPYWEQTGVTENNIIIDTNSNTDGRYHSNWLNMMTSRLLIARSLLKPEGVIFLSIDDNEITHLRKLCDEIFGEENFVAQITLLCNPKGRSQDKYFASNHEYILVYSKEILPKGSFSIEKDEEQIELEYTEEDEIGKFRLLELRNTHREFGKHNRKNLHYPFYVNIDNDNVSLEKNGNSIETLPNWDDGFEGCWTWDKTKASRDLDYLVAKKNSIGKYKIYRKNYANGSDRMLKTIFIDKQYYTEKGQSVFNSLFSTKQKIFQSPKSVDLLKALIKTSSSNTDLILDFFAGSGSTGNAVTELNQEDGAKRKYILVQIPEITDEKSEAYKAGYKKISEITIERNKRVVERIIKQKKEEHPDLFTNGNENEELKGLGFKVFKLVKSNFPRAEWSPDPNKTEEENTTVLKKYIAEKESQLISAFNKNDLMTEILLKQGFLLNIAITKQPQFTKNDVIIATDGVKETLLCLDNTIENETVTYFKSNKEKKFICLERSLDTTKKWNLKHYLEEKFIAF